MRILIFMGGFLTGAAAMLVAVWWVLSDTEEGMNA